MSYLKYFNKIIKNKKTFELMDELENLKDNKEKLSLR